MKYCIVAALFAIIVFVSPAAAVPDLLQLVKTGTGPEILAAKAETNF